MARASNDAPLNIAPRVNVQQLPAPTFPIPNDALTGSDLTPLAQSFWAKSGGSGQNVWLPVYQHLMDASDVAGLLFDRYLSQHHRDLLALPWEGDQKKARTSLIFFAGVHDVGKISLEFCCQHSPLAQFVRDLGIEVPERRDLPNRKDLPHGYASHFAIIEAITAGGGHLSRAEQWAATAAVHHGRYPNVDQMTVAHSTYSFGFGSKTQEPRWDNARQEVVRWMACRSGFPITECSGTDLPKLPIASAAAYASAIVMADWIASNETWFPLLSCDERHQPLTDAEQKERVATGWRYADMPTPLKVPVTEVSDAKEAYRDRFGWGEEVTPTCTQIRAVEIARECNPDMMIVEAPPGSGKTELAFMVAEEIMRQRHLQGVMVALPTQATTDAMYERSRKWLASLLHELPQRIDLHLAHGKNLLNESFVKLLDSGRSPVQIYDEDEVKYKKGLHASAWMAGRWRATLSPVVIGTIDQILLTSLKARHVLVRHLGLMGKVVIIDEVHAADTYMQTYLKGALTWLGMYRVPVVLLSATLPHERKVELLAAYQSGRVGSSAEATPELPSGYPSITWLHENGSIAETEQTAGVETHTPKYIRLAGGTSVESLVDILEDKVNNGACAVVIRNTVKSAQETYAAVCERMGTERVTLMHSRFLSCDRVTKDLDLLQRFGRDGARPTNGHVVVSTQVIEQSLDVDFDVMVTDPAPMDLVLQRIGRLHRHQRKNRPIGCERPQCYILAETDAVPWCYDRGTDAVYGAHKVLRFLAILSENPEGIVVEKIADFETLTQRAYSSCRVGPDEWQGVMDAAAQELVDKTQQAIAKANSHCLNEVSMPTWTSAHLLTKFAGNNATGDGEVNKAGVKAQAAVRDSEDQIPVLIVPVDAASGGVAIHPPWRRHDDGLAVPFDTSVFPPADLVREICRWGVSLPPWQFRNKVESIDDCVDAVVGAIWDHEIARTWKFLEHPLLRGELVLPMYRVDEFSTRLEAELYGRRLVYTPEKGLEVLEG
ncbi:CRISPR-associated helicase Cas3' [Schaalia suimastitidis]|uniref:CRISPR-associated helicase Cas3' n=1 Tax=Schaalia suimastitidis TaxID=121163 RepID=UPI000413148E|nr:CRISPR-associated helicase Cas3' [Schaalia suimastitidis]